MSGETMVRRRVLALVLIPTLLLSGLLAFFGYRDYQMLRDGLMAQGTQDAEHLADLAEFGLATANILQLQEAARSMLSQRASSVVSARIYGEKGEPLVLTGNDAAITGSATSVAGPCGETREFFFFCAPVRMKPLPVEQFSEFGNGQSEGVSLGHVEVALSSKLLRSRRSVIVTGYATILLIVFGAGMVFARRAERDLARPIAELRDAVERVGRGELSLRIDETAHGELLTLQHGFNAMAASIETHHAQQQRRIEEATARLRQTLNELEIRNAELHVEKQRAEASSHAKSRFLAMMSHEIRTPIAGMIGMLTLLKGSGLNAEQASYLRHVNSAAQALRLLIDEILDYSRIEAGKMELFNDPIRVSRVVEEAITMLAPSAADKGLEFIVDMEPGLPDAVMGDALRLRQILINLTANAIKFTERGFVRIEVRNAGGTQALPRLRFAVEDSGIGIAQEKQAQVFESFSQVDSGPTRRYGGSGLGTTICRELVRLMGGEIGFSSTEGEGSRFWFELSLVREPHAPVEPKPLRERRVGVIERESHARAALVAALQDLGAEVVTSDGTEPLSIGTHALDFLLVCEEGLDLSQLQTVVPTKELSGTRCQVMAVNGIEQSGYRYRFIKPVTRIRLLSQLDLSPEKTKADATIGPTQPCLKILVAEDDDINARVIELLLRRLGHDVTHVHNGREALDILAREPFDAAILDVRMPQVDGTAVAEQWRAREREVGGHLPLFALTANGSTEDMERCRAAGMDEFLVKPIGEKRLAELLDRLVPTAAPRHANSGCG